LFIDTQVTTAATKTTTTTTITTKPTTTTTSSLRTRNNISFSYDNSAFNVSIATLMSLCPGCGDVMTSSKVNDSQSQGHSEQSPLSTGECLDTEK